MTQETILAIGAHNDDHLIGAGGALAKYGIEGKRVVTLVFSYGAKSQPHVKKDIIIAKRIKESIKADKMLKGSGVTYFGVREGKFDEDFKKKDIERRLVQIIKKENPSKIFTHDNADAHPDHRAVNRLIMRLIKKGKIDCPVYSFEIWSLFKLRKRNVPRLVVDTSDTFNMKVKAFLVHKSQLQMWMLPMWALFWKLIVKDWLSGVIHGYRFAEVFYRLK